MAASEKKYLKLQLPHLLLLQIYRLLFFIWTGITEKFEKFYGYLNVMRCAIWYQTLKNGLRMGGQNTVLNGLARKAFLSIRLHGIQTLI